MPSEERFLGDPVDAAPRVDVEGAYSKCAGHIVMPSVSVVFLAAPVGQQSDVLSSVEEVCDAAKLARYRVDSTLVSADELPCVVATTFFDDEAAAERHVHLLLDALEQDKMPKSLSCAYAVALNGAGRAFDLDRLVACRQGERIARLERMVRQLQRRSTGGPDE